MKRPVIEENSTLAIDAGVITYNGYRAGDPRDHREVIRRIIFNIWGVGLIADITALAAKVKRIGAFSNTLASLMKIFTHKPFSVQAKIDGGEKKYLACPMITASNSRYTGGNMKIAPDARVDDGKLFMICVREISPLKFLILLPAVINGRSFEHPLVQTQFVQNPGVAV